MSEFPWNQAIDLNSIDESFSNLSPLYVLWQFYRTKSSGSLSFEVPQYTFEVRIADGKIQGLRGVPRLLSSLGIESLPGAGLEEMIGMAMGQGHSYTEVLKHAAQDFGVCLILTAQFEEGRIRTIATETGRPVEIPLTIAGCVEFGLRQAKSENDLLREYASKMRNIVVLHPLDFNPAQLSLPMPALKLLRKINGEQRLSELLPNAAVVSSEWRHLDLLCTLGLLSFKVVERKAKKKNNDESLKKYEELRDTLQQFKQEEPHQIFQLTKPAEITDITIDQRFRNLSKRYHPDKFIGEDNRILQLVADIYSLINDTHSALQNEDLRVELKARLEAEQRGEKYVSPEHTQKAELIYAQGQFFFRKRKYSEAKDILDQALALNPYNWRVKALRMRTLVQLNEVQKGEAAEALLAITEARGKERNDLAFHAAELLFSAGEEEKAYELFEKVVEVDDSNIDAKRYLQRRQVKSRKEESKRGFFGGLFSKRKS